MSAWLERFRPALNELGAYNPRGLRGRRRAVSSRHRPGLTEPLHPEAEGDGSWISSAY
jgi:hypothetical protein